MTDQIKITAANLAEHITFGGTEFDFDIESGLTVHVQFKLDKLDIGYARYGAVMNGAGVVVPYCDEDRVLEFVGDNWGKFGDMVEDSVVEAIVALAEKFAKVDVHVAFEEMALDALKEIIDDEPSLKQIMAMLHAAG